MRAVLDIQQDLDAAYASRSRLIQSLDVASTSANGTAVTAAQAATVNGMIDRLEQELAAAQQAAADAAAGLAAVPAGRQVAITTVRRW